MNNEKSLRPKRHYERNEVECDNPFAFITKPGYAQLCVICKGIATEPHRTTPVLFFAMTAVGGEK